MTASGAHLILIAAGFTILALIGVGFWLCICKAPEIDPYGLYEDDDWGGFP